MMLNRRTTTLLASAVIAPLIAVGAMGASMASTSAPAATTQLSAPVTAHRTAVLATTSGVTMLKLDSATAKALTSNGVTVAPASEARPGPSGIAFPIRGGLLNPANLHGYITHDGGLTFTAGGKSLTIRDFTVRTTTGRLTGYVDEAHARIPILNLSLAHAKVSGTKGSLGVTGVKATLNGTAAKALNSYFSTKLFTAGLKIGTVRLSAKTSTLYR